MLFSLFDNAAHVFGPLIAFESEEVARRNFILIMLSQSKSAIKDFPDDFILYAMGDFDASSGVITSFPAPIKVMTGFEAVELSNQYLYKKAHRESILLNIEEKGEINNGDFNQKSDVNTSAETFATAN